MAEKTRAELDAYFNTGDTPSDAQFQDLIDSTPNFQEDDYFYGKEINITAFVGGGQLSAYQLSKHLNVVTTVNNPLDSIKLPAGNVVRKIFICNFGGNALHIYPFIGGEINKLGVNIAYPLAINTSVYLFNWDNLKWIVLG